MLGTQGVEAGQSEVEGYSWLQARHGLTHKLGDASLIHQTWVKGEGENHLHKTYCDFHIPDVAQPHHHIQYVCEYY